MTSLDHFEFSMIQCTDFISMIKWGATGARKFNVFEHFIWKLSTYLPFAFKWAVYAKLYNDELQPAWILKYWSILYGR